MPSLQGRYVSSLSKSMSRLTVIQVTDVYTLENFPSLKNLIAAKKRENPNTVSVRSNLNKCLKFSLDIIVYYSV